MGSRIARVAPSSFVAASRRSFAVNAGGAGSGVLEGSHRARERQGKVRHVENGWLGTACQDVASYVVRDTTMSGKSLGQKPLAGSGAASRWRSAGSFRSLTAACQPLAR